MEEKHWILSIPILKSLGFALLIINIIGLPIIFTISNYPAFYQKTDFLKMVFTTTSFGAVYGSSIFVSVLFANMISTKYQAKDLRFYESVMIDILICFCLSDVALMFNYQSSGQIMSIKNFMHLNLGCLFSIFGLHIINRIFPKKES